MNLYLISQEQNNDWDTYDSAVVAAPDEETARNMHPGTGEPVAWGKGHRWSYNSWCRSVDDVEVFLLATMVGRKQGVVLASFNAG